MDINKSLYSTEFEHDACGVGLIANIHGTKSHKIVEGALRILEKLTHRGGESADNKTGDGAGLLMQIPHEFILLQGVPVPERGKYGTGLLFLPRDNDKRCRAIEIAKNVVNAEPGLEFFMLRDVPVNSEILGSESRRCEPCIKQIFITSEEEPQNLERRLFRARKKLERAFADANLGDDVYCVSLSSQSIVYKGMLTSTQLGEYFLDLHHPNFATAIAVVHSRFSTNTFPAWKLAQPFRMLAHNGEINTIRGNRAWMAARESMLDSAELGEAAEFSPILQPGMSDSASLDNALEFLVMSGKSLPHALAMLIPESWNDTNPISDNLKAFYEYHSIFMEPWDGPAAILFSDGRYAGGLLDRNGLRPARYMITKAGTLLVASEVGVLDVPAEKIRERGRLRPGKMLLVDTQTGTIHYDRELKENLARAFPYRQWLDKNRVDLVNLASGRHVGQSVENYVQNLVAFGYSKEDADEIIMPISLRAAEPPGSMGNDAAPAICSEKPQRLFNYFRQLFAQVTNPPIDPIREELVMALTGYIGSLHKNILKPMPEHCKVVKIRKPILTNRALDLLSHLAYKGFKSRKISMLFRVPEAGENAGKALADAVEALCRSAEAAVDSGVQYIILSDRGIDAEHAAIPSLLAVSAVHHYLSERKKRFEIDILVESAEPRETMHFALLFGYGANAINPYLVYAIINEKISTKELPLDFHAAEQNYIKGISKGLLKILSKMGISTLRSYRAAQMFEAIGISDSLIEKYFPGTISRFGGIDIDDVAREVLEPHSRAFPKKISAEENAAPTPENPLNESLGIYHFRRGGETHAWTPQIVSLLKTAARKGDYAKFKEFTAAVDSKKEKIFLRDFFDFRRGNAIPLEQVEPAEAIMKRFVSGAMSFGSISKEAHECIAIAMNTIGGRSNSGEGGEDPERFKPRADGTSARSAIKQVASGRFGVTTEYLVNADEIQIKISQGAKPGEGGQLPGFKVNDIIAKTRHSIPGISLISPPPHHDIYSIEDLAQLIFDLKNVNPSANVTVKLVSESGVGTIAAGVAKAHADGVTISGAEGGTGAAPISSVKWAGLPLETGLAETHQTLVMNNLRGRVVLQADGQLKTARDVILVALLGAEEFGFSTALLITLNCVQCRNCHTNTCPVGIATQDPERRKKFSGKPEFVVNYFKFLAEEIRENLAQMGFAHFDDIVGRTDLLEISRENLTEKEKKIDFSRLVFSPDVPAGTPIRKTIPQNLDISSVLDMRLIKAFESGTRNGVFEIANTDRAVGAMLSGKIAKADGGDGLPGEPLSYVFRGNAGQSFGAFLVRGVKFRLEGAANDYLGKGLSGGEIAVVPAAGTTFCADANVIAGNTLLYGATSGAAFINGRVGERFCVRNSGAIAVAEGVGDHACEYMTGGRVVVLGKTGRNFAAGMSGGIAYVYNEKGDFDYFCNMEMIELSLLETEEDEAEARTLIERHATATQSPKAKRILDNWEKERSRFIKVTPIEYKKIMEKK
ncbi:MAG: glutamate synthase large subunit [Opitutae bacterium]|nr:glutamate synthase large subunit [Opitutae bacterium]